MKNAIIDKAIEDYKAGVISVEECNKILAEQKAGYYFDPKKNPAGGWTEQEMKEGFIEQPAGADVPERPDMSRKPELANTTVRSISKAGAYDVVRDELGYAVKAIRVQF